MQNTAILVKGLQKSYNKLHVLKGVDFEVEKGTIFALLGSNGAGKTTIIKILTTLLKQDSGTATVNGFDVAAKPDDVRQSISLTGQFAAVDEILTGRENLIMIARLRHLKNPRQVADDLLNRFGLSEAAGRRVSTYSGGMRRRLDIAMSLIGKPQLIFLDEPTNGLDPEARSEVWKTVKELANNGTTVFLTTQYLDEAEQLADQIAILHEGRIIAKGTLADLKKLFPPAKVEYVEKQPSLEEIFLAIIGKKEQKVKWKIKHFFSDMGVMLGRSMRHIFRSLDTIITVAITPIAMMLLFVYVFGGAIKTGTDNYVNYLLPGILLIAIASGIAYTSYRLFLDMQSGIFERFHSMPIARSTVLWGHVLTSLVSNAISVVVIILVALGDGLPLVGGGAGMAGRGRYPGPVYPGLDLDRGDCRVVRKSMDGASAFAYPISFCRSSARPLCRLPRCRRSCVPLPKTSRSPPSSMRSVLCWRGSRSAMISGWRLRGASGLCSWLISLP